MSILKKDYVDEIMDRGEYALVPNEFYRRRDIDAIAKIIWGEILSLPPNWQASRNRLATMLGLSKDTVSSKIADLERANMLKGFCAGTEFAPYTTDPLDEDQVNLQKEVTCPELDKFTADVKTHTDIFNYFYGSF